MLGGIFLFCVILLQCWYIHNVKKECLNKAKYRRLDSLKHREDVENLEAENKILREQIKDLRYDLNQVMHKLEGKK